MYTDEVIKEAESMDIVDFCLRNNIRIKSDSERYYRLVDHDSCVIDRRKNCFHWNSKGLDGNVIKFIQEIEGVNFKESMEKLVGNAKIEYQNNQKNKKVKQIVEAFVYSKNKEVSDFNKARHYLIKERRIDHEIVDHLHKIGLIKQDKFNNVLFLWKEHETIMGCNEQGIIKTERFKHGSWKKIQKNSTANYGFNVLNGKPKNLKFFESDIDLLSYFSLNKYNLGNVHLISMNGLKHNTIFNYIEKARVQLKDEPDSISLCVDNDEAGLKFIEKLKKIEAENDGNTYNFTTEIPHKPLSVVKWDWNDECKYKSKIKEKMKINRDSRNINTER